MKNITLKKLIVSGNGKSDSIIEFEEGLNIILGPSNTGKSLIMDCIDYAFGFKPKKNSPSKIVDNNEGYEKIYLELETAHGLLSLERNINESRIKVQSDIPFIQNKYYSISTSARNNISDVLLKLIGIDDKIKILKNSKGDLQNLSWRTIMHLFFMMQNDIYREKSALLSPNDFSRTPSMSAFFYLATGKDLSNLVGLESNEIILAKRKAVEEYIDYVEKNIDSKKGKLNNLIKHNNFDNIEKLIDSTNSSINEMQSLLNETEQQSRKIISELFKENTKLSECNTLLKSFDSLYKQYMADIKRLELIFDGEVAINDEPKDHYCPFCKSKIDTKLESICSDSALSELRKIEIHLNELQKAIDDTKLKRDKIKLTIKNLEIDKKKITDEMENKLKPQLASFNKKLLQYIDILKWKNQIELIDEFKENIQINKIHEVEETDFRKENINLFDLYDSTVLAKFEETLADIFKDFNVGGANTVKFNKNTFDIMLGDKNKASSMGGGYCALLNVLTALSFQVFIDKNTRYSPGFFIIDSPLTQLSESKETKYTDTIKYNFMQQIVKESQNRQIIIIEQEDSMPKNWETIANHSTKITRFTRQPHNDRYGFLTGVVNEEHKNI